MALIECDECGAQISDKASACPKCGNPLTHYEEEVDEDEEDDDDETKPFFKTLFESKLFLWICFLAGLAGVFAGFFWGDNIFQILGEKWSDLNHNMDYTNAYVGIPWWKIYKVLPFCYLFIGLIFLYITVPKIFPKLNKGFLAVIIIAIISSFGFLANKDKTELETELKTLQAEQKKKESDPEFKKSKAGADLLKQELKNCTFVKYMSDMPDDVINNYCNGLNELSIKTWNKPLTGLGLQVFQATYENDYGNQVTDRFYVFYKDDKPIKFAKENIIREWSELDMLFLMIHNFE